MTTTCGVCYCIHMLELENQIISYTVEPELLDDHVDFTHGGLTMFDMDDTLVTSQAHILVVDKQGQLLQRLHSTNYRSYQLQPGERFSYEEFSSSEVFKATSQPIERMVSRACEILHHIAHRPRSQVIILTARSDFDNNLVFLQSLAAHGIDTNKIHVEFAGNLTCPAPEAKARITSRYLNSGKFDRVRLIDDHVDNLVAFLRLQPLYPHVRFSAYLVLGDGDIQPYGITADI